jgi:hypothetical protein
MITTVSIGEKFDVQHVVKDRFMHITLLKHLSKHDPQTKYSSNIIQI